jgi:hypothetical protein
MVSFIVLVKSYSRIEERGERRRRRRRRRSRSNRSKRRGGPKHGLFVVYYS